MIKRKNKTWKSWDIVKSELEIIVAASNGILPGSSRFKELGYGGLYTTLITTYGGINAVRKRMGLDRYKFCKKCSKVVNKSMFRRKKHKRGYHLDNICKHCSDENVKNYRSTWEGKAASLYRSSKNRAKKNGFEFNLSKEWILDRLKFANYKCEATGIELTPDTRGSGVGFSSRFGPSLDRIDSTKGYTVSNVRITANRTNIALGNLTDEEFEQFAVGFLLKRGWNISNATSTTSRNFTT